MKKLNQSFKNITNPIVDFVVAEDLKKQPKYVSLIYEKIYSEIFFFLQDKKKAKIDKCKLKDGIGKIIFKDSNKEENKLKIVFDNLNVF